MTVLVPLLAFPPPFRAGVRFPLLRPLRLAAALQTLFFHLQQEQLQLLPLALCCHLLRFVWTLLAARFCCPSPLPLAPFPYELLPLLSFRPLPKLRLALSPLQELPATPCSPRASRCFPPSTPARHSSHLLVPRQVVQLLCLALLLVSPLL